jgi:hypothetical protein
MTENIDYTALKGFAFLKWREKYGAHGYFSQSQGMNRKQSCEWMCKQAGYRGIEDALRDAEAMSLHQYAALVKDTTAMQGQARVISYQKLGVTDKTALDRIRMGADTPQNAYERVIREGKPSFRVAVQLPLTVATNAYIEPQKTHGAYLEKLKKTKDGSMYIVVVLGVIIIGFWYLLLGRRT